MCVCQKQMQMDMIQGHIKLLNKVPEEETKKQQQLGRITEVSQMEALITSLKYTSKPDGAKYIEPTQSHTHTKKQNKTKNPEVTKYIHIY